jgi:hypothetical protein
MLGTATQLARSAATAARHPVRSTAHAVGFAKGAATSGTALVTAAASRMLHDDRSAQQEAADVRVPPAPAPAVEPVSESPEVPEPEVVLREPGPPEEPPVDVVGQALAAEEETPAPPTAADEVIEDLKGSGHRPQ